MSIKELWARYNPFDIGSLVEELHTDFTQLRESLNHIEDKMDNKLQQLEANLEFQESLVNAISNTVPDMIWLKDCNGKYLYANNAIKTGLLFSDDPIGKTDIELSMKAKDLFGDDNHTFGDICGNSDFIIIDTRIPQRFLEYGKVKGKDLYLEVYKAPFFIKGEFAGICGVGRDLTPYVEAYRASHCSSCELTKNNDIFSLFEFKG